MKVKEIEEPRGTFGPIAIRALAVGAQSIGAVAVGAVALSAVAIGFIAIGRLVIGRAKIKRLEIGELRVTRLHVTDSMITFSFGVPEREPSASTLATTSRPDTTLPNSEYCGGRRTPSGPLITKNWLPFVFGPALAIANEPTS